MIHDSVIKIINESQEIVSHQTDTGLGLGATLRCSLPTFHQRGDLRPSRPAGTGCHSNAHQRPLALSAAQPRCLGQGQPSGQIKNGTYLY